MMTVIIPTYNEAAHIQSTIEKLREHDEAKLITEIIVADGGSTDDTVAVAKDANVKVVVSTIKGRSAQMNYGASFAKENTVYFLHADTIPPKNFSTDIAMAIEQVYDAGCFMLSFDYAHWFLKANCWFTRFDVDAIRFGDQSLFITKILFEKMNGFCEKHIVLEDQQLIKRVKKAARFTIIKKPVLTSARKYIENGIYKTQGIFFIIYGMYRLGYSQQKLVAAYQKMIRQNKI
jgi:rSAM/selenodomain-associated transferase 2